VYKKECGMNVMEFVVKITMTLVIIVAAYYQFCILKWTWTNQIDVKATLSRILKKAKPDTDFIAVRDPNEIYQTGSPVGDVTGTVVIRGDLIEFEELSNTQGLDKSIPFEYRRDRYQIEKVGSSTLMDLSRQGSGKMVRKDAVMRDVTCRKVK
jgi:hypothetical protein